MVGGVTVLVQSGATMLVNESLKYCAKAALKNASIYAASATASAAANYALDYLGVSEETKSKIRIVLDLFQVVSFFKASRLIAKAKGPGSCFVAGTQVIVGVNDDGSLATRSIEEIEEGDRVLSRDQHDAADDLDLRPVTRVFRKVSDHLRILTIEGDDGNVETIQTTDSHPFYVEGRGWVGAGDLQIGDRVQETDGSWQSLLATEREEHPGDITVYNLEVEGDHTYFVEDGFGGADAVWVHNAGEVCGISTHVSKKMMGRGWMQKDITDTVAAPFRTATVDRNGQPFKNLATGHSATAYIREDGHGVLRDDGTGEVFHVSNINDPDWQFYWSWPQ
jgi:hypothetical protein